MITDDEYQKALGIVYQYEKERKEGWFDVDDCKKCVHWFSNPFDQWYCDLEYDLENDKDCGGKEYIKENENPV